MAQGVMVASAKGQKVQQGRAWTVEVLHDPGAVERLAVEWDALEAVAVGPTLYAGRAYTMAAWQHLRRPGDRWWLVAVRDGRTGILVGVLPLWGRRERRLGVPITVLIHPGILEGERPDVLSSIDPDEVWAAAWQALQARRSRWHRWDLREVDEGAWPLRWASGPQAQDPRGGWRVRVAPDTAAPWRRASDPTPSGLPQALPLGCVLEVFTDASSLCRAWPRHLALEQAMSDAGVPMSGTVRVSPGAPALYDAWWPTLAQQGRVQLAFLRDEAGQDRASLLRLREPLGAHRGVGPRGGGAAWLERHAAWLPGPQAGTDVTALWSAMQHGAVGDGAMESQRVHVPEPVPRLEAAYPHLRRTHQWSVWNLRSRVGLLMALQRWVGRPKKDPG